jgi:hypothetical protein
VPFSLSLLQHHLHRPLLLIMQPPQQNYAESPEFLPIKNKMDVVHYSHCLWSLYIKPETSQLARYHWKVSEIKTYMNKGTEIKHEYLIATLNDGDKGEILLWIGRDFSAVVEVAIVEPNLPNSDMQQLVQHIGLNDKSRISLPQLIVLACVIGNYSRKYRLFEKGSCWLCFAIGELLLKHSWENTRVSSLRQEVNLHALFAKYYTMWNAFENDVCPITEDSDITDMNGSWQIKSIINRQDRPWRIHNRDQQHWQQQYASKTTPASVLNHVPLEECLQTMRDAATRPSSPTPPLPFHATFQLLITTLTGVCTSWN